jgi:hypothetical protein
MVKVDSENVVIVAVAEWYRKNATKPGTKFLFDLAAKFDSQSNDRAPQDLVADLDQVIANIHALQAAIKKRLN